MRRQLLASNMACLFFITGWNFFFPFPFFPSKLSMPKWFLFGNKYMIINDCWKHTVLQCGHMYLLMRNGGTEVWSLLVEEVGIKGSLETSFNKTLKGILVNLSGWKQGVWRKYGCFFKYYEISNTLRQTWSVAAILSLLNLADWYK